MTCSNFTAWGEVDPHYSICSTGRMPFGNRGCAPSTTFLSIFLLLAGVWGLNHIPTPSRLLDVYSRSQRSLSYFEFFGTVSKYLLHHLCKSRKERDREALYNYSPPTYAYRPHRRSSFGLVISEVKRAT